MSLHYCPPEREICEGGHGADGEVVEQLAPDLLPDLPALLARQTVAREQGAQLLHLVWTLCSLGIDKIAVTLSVSAPFISPTQVVRLVWARMWPGPWYH